MCVDPSTGVPVHRVVLPGRVGGHALRALIGDFSSHLHYNIVNHGGRMDATMISGVEGTMLDALKTTLSGLFAPAEPSLMMTKMVVQVNLPTSEGIRSGLYPAYTWAFDLRNQEILNLMRLIDTKPAADPPQDWMQPAMQGCPQARRLLQPNFWMYWMRVCIVAGGKLPPPPPDMPTQMAQPEPMEQANSPMGQTMLPIAQAYRPEAQAASGAAAVASLSTAPIHPAVGVRAGAPAPVADAAAEAESQARRLREHRAAILRLTRGDRRAAGRKGKGVDRRLHPLQLQAPEAAAAVEN